MEQAGPTTGSYPVADCTQDIIMDWRGKKTLINNSPVPNKQGCLKQGGGGGKVFKNVGGLIRDRRAKNYIKVKPPPPSALFPLFNLGL